MARFGRTVGAGIALLATLVAAAPALAAQLPDQTLSSGSQVITWQGKAADPTGQGYWFPTEQSCSPDTCDSFVLKIDMPKDSFPKGPKHPAPPGTTRVEAEGPTDMPGDGVLISIHWATDFDQYNLYVDDMSTGQTVAQGIDLDSDAQSVLLSQPHNGSYRVTVVPFYTNFDKADMSYKGEARPFRDPTQRYANKTTLLPQIQTMPPSNFHIGDVPPLPSNPTGWRFTSNGTFSNSCYLDETAQFGSQRCLRFDNIIRNVGVGPLVLRFSWSPDALTNNCSMQQELLSTDSTVTDRGAGPCVFHPQHAHFHYQNMGVYQLYSVDPSGAPGAKPVATSRKVGFCTIDVEDYSFGLPADEQRPRTYSFPTCNIPNAYTDRSDGPYGPASPPEYMGISPGWGDIYTWDLPGQYIDVTNVPDGTYEVVSRSNPDGGMLTAGRERETGVTCVKITGTTVKTLREFPSEPTFAPLPRCGSVAVLAHRKHHRRHRHKRHHRRHHHRATRHR
ncbi:MAG: hypothetical protein ACJ76Z_11945 [Thermoleophilaceae bacterium]